MDTRVIYFSGGEKKFSLFLSFVPGVRFEEFLNGTDPRTPISGRGEIFEKGSSTFFVRGRNFF